MQRAAAFSLLLTMVFVACSPGDVPADTGVAVDATTTRDATAEDASAEDSSAEDADLADADLADGGEDGAAVDAAIATDGGGLTDAAPMDIPRVRYPSSPSACPGRFATTAPTNGTHTGFMSGGQSRTFHAILPAASFTGPRPLFVGFNGTTENGPAFATRARLSEFAERGFIVIAPSSNGNGRIWPPWDDMRRPDDHAGANADVQLFDDLLACMAGHYEVDQNRIYVGGHSAGGIFTNAIIQRRSNVIAGAITASGLFDLTAPVPARTLEPVFVIVTWGGPNDQYTGGPGGGITINFVEQASRASQAYETHPAVSEMNCTANPGVGHAWLRMNSYFIDRLLEHPKGLPGVDGSLTVPTAPSPYRCNDTSFVHTPSQTVSCRASTSPYCQQICQRTADCVAENDTVNLPLSPQLQMMGFSLAGSRVVCDGCVSNCERVMGTTADATTIPCFLNASQMCSGGITGFLPYSQGINQCCSGRTDSAFCRSMCTVMNSNPIAPSLLPVCAAF